MRPAVRQPPPLATGPLTRPPRVRAGGKYLFVGDEKFYVRGATYGTFSGESRLPPPDVVATDLAAMAANGLNTLRTYTVPPAWMLDLVAGTGLRVLVGVPWEQHVAFLESAARRRSIVERLAEGVRACAGHPAVLGYAVGNEIPPSIVRWHGARRVERFIEQLYRVAKEVDPEGLVTYVNFPSTEYLHLPFLDFVCFNLFLEDPQTLFDYLARLHVQAGDRPLVLTELGLDSRRHGLRRQAEAVGEQLRASFGAGIAGACVFAWTDEWHRGEFDVGDWDFGLVARDRDAKPALSAARAAFAHAPFPPSDPWPSASVVVCSHNGARTIGGCLAALRELEYAAVEIVVVDDGSTDATAAIAESAGVRVIRTENRGLSSARNTGARESTGEVVAFCDDDCEPDPHWLKYLVTTLLHGDHDGVGGPNIPPQEGFVPDAVGHAPGSATHVLVSDHEAEHIPGCNMAYWRRTLEAVGGFDERFRVAGDDVDLCWRVQDAGGRLGFSPGAVVWHHARGSVAAYLRQQSGYGRAEALLERKWPERYNRRGHVKWAGDVQGGRVRRAGSRRRWRVYYGASGSGLFQSVYGSRRGVLDAFHMTPERYLGVFLLAAAAALGLLGGPDLPEVPLMHVTAWVVFLAVALVGISLQPVAWVKGVLLPPSMSLRRRCALRLLLFFLCLLQPLARLWGRASGGLTPWRRRGPVLLRLPRRRTVSVWSEVWRSPADWVARLQSTLNPRATWCRRGGDFDTWDLETRTGGLAAGRIRVAVEEHGQGRQLVRFRVWPRWSWTAAAAVLVLAAAALLSATAGAWAAAAALGLIALWLLGRILAQAAASTVLPARAAERLAEAPDAAVVEAVRSVGEQPLIARSRA